MANTIVECISMSVVMDGFNINCSVNAWFRLFFFTPPLIFSLLLPKPYIPTFFQLPHHFFSALTHPGDKW